MLELIHVTVSSANDHLSTWEVLYRQPEPLVVRFSHKKALGDHSARVLGVRTRGPQNTRSDCSGRTLRLDRRREILGVRTRGSYPGYSGCVPGVLGLDTAHWRCVLGVLGLGVRTRGANHSGCVLG